MDHTRAALLRALTLPVAVALALVPLGFARAEPAGSTSSAEVDLDEALGRGGRQLGVAEAVELAQARSPSVERANAALELARAGAREARLAFVPRVDISGRYLRLGGFEDGAIAIGGGEIPREQALALASSVEDPAAQLLLTAMIEQQSGLTEVTFETPRNQTAFRANLTIPLTDLFLRIWPASRAAEGQVRLEEARLAAERSDVALSVEEAYYRYAQARGALAVAEGALTLATDHHELMSALVEAELGAPADELAAAARVAAARGAIARTQGGVTLARTALQLLIGLEDDGEELALDGSLTTGLALPPEVTDELVERAYSLRPEVRALRELVGVQEQSARAARGGHSPRLLLVAGGEVSNPNQRVIPPQDEFTPSWEVGLVMSWSPNDSMAASAQTRAAQARQRMVEADLARLRDALRLQLEQARVEQRAAAAVMAAASERIEAARASLEARQAELRAGQAVATQRLDAELELTRARLELLTAAVDQRVAEARFRHALGEEP